MITTNDILKAFEREPVGEGIPIASATQDSREVISGSLFVALKGEASDGHIFIGDAVARGAVAIVCDNAAAIPAALCVIDLRAANAPMPAFITAPVAFLVTSALAALQRIAAYWRAQMPVRVIGVTGSVGKTTTKEMIASVLSRRFSVLKSERNLNNEIGLPLTLLHLTPEHEIAVLEMGMYDLGEIRFLCQIALPSTGVVTNVGPTHLERLGTLERIAQAKAELVEALPADGWAVLNGDDPLVRPMAQATKAHVLQYGQAQSLDLWADEVESMGLEGMRLRLHRGKESVYFRVPILGEHSVHTVLAATAVALTLGLTWDEIDAGLRVMPDQLRLVVVPGRNGETIIDDTYNSSPASALAALNLLSELDGRRVAVLGDMLELGSYEDEGHKLVGRRAATVVSQLVVVGPRGRYIGHEALAAGMPPESVATAADNAQAVEILKSLLQPGDFVLVKGSRGMKMEEIVQAIRV